MPEPIVSVAEMRAREQRTWDAGVSPKSVILRAGAAVAESALRWTRPGAPVLVLAGHGNNGEDAIAAQQRLRNRDTRLLLLRNPGAFDLAIAWLDERRGDPRALIIDGLFGIGLNRPLDGQWRALVEAMNRSEIRVLSIDVPSGMDADTGEPRGAAVRAWMTLTLGAVKTGLLRQSAGEYVGRLEMAHDIGLLAESTEARELWTIPGDFAGFPPRRPVEGHKGTFGHVLILAGSLGYHGAAVLAARGALRARPGLVTVVTDERCYAPVASQLTSAMVRPWRGGPLGDDGITAIVVGPGLASPDLDPAIRGEIRRLWTSAPAVVIADASALDWLPSSENASTPNWRVITPHPGEAARLLGTQSDQIQSDRFDTLRRLAGLSRETRTLVVLKGRHTLVGDGAGPIHVNPSGGPGLAQGGTGDALAGYLGGLLAQPALQRDVSLTVRYAVWRHGAAADALDLGAKDWTTDELVEALGTTPECGPVH